MGASKRTRFKPVQSMDIEVSQACVIDLKIRWIYRWVRETATRIFVIWSDPSN